MPGTILLTGGSGFLGSYCARQLSLAGHRVVSLDVTEPGPRSRWIQGQGGAPVELLLGNAEHWGVVVGAILAHRPDAIIHNASFVRPDVLAREPLTALRASVEPSLVVFEAARVLGVQRVVFVSSIGVLPPGGPRPIGPNHPIFLDSRATPDTFYGAAKVATEAFGFAYLEGFGLDVIVVRPSALYGFGMNWPMYIRPMVENSLEGLPTRFATGAEMPRDYTHVADVAELIRCAVEIPTSRVQERIFYGGTGEEPVTAGNVAEIVRRLIPGADIEIGPGLADDEILDARTRGRFDMSAAKEQLGFQPRFTKIQKGLTEYIEQWRAFHAAAGD